MTLSSSFYFTIILFSIQVKGETRTNLFNIFHLHPSYLDSLNQLTIEGYRFALLEHYSTFLHFSMFHSSSGEQSCSQYCLKSNQCQAYLVKSAGNGVCTIFDQLPGNNATFLHEKSGGKVLYTKNAQIQTGFIQSSQSMEISDCLLKHNISIRSIDILGPTYKPSEDCFFKGRSQFFGA